MSDLGKAVFLSYASQDAEAAKRICDALRAAGVEVWFDQSELVGGDQWDGKIRGQISSCALFVPIISANTQARLEGYFRIEWKLAARRTHAMATAKAFLLPIVIDDTHDASAHVPDEFRDVQWTRLKGGETPPTFAQRVKKLLSGGGTSEDRGQRTEVRTNGTSQIVPTARPRWLAPVIAGGVIALLVLILARPWAKTQPPPAAKPAESAAAAVKPDSEARKLIQRATEIFSRSGLQRESMDSVWELANRAVLLDPTDEEVLGPAARIDAWTIYMGYDRSRERRQQAQKRAALAMTLAPNSPAARWARAAVFAFADGSPAMLVEGEKILRSLATESGNKSVLTDLGTVLRDEKKFGEAAVVFERADDLGAAGWNYLFAGRIDDARRMALAQPRGPGALNLQIAIEWWGAEDLTAAYAIASGLSAEELLNEDLAMWATLVFLARPEPERVIRTLNAFPPEVFEGKGYRGPKRYFTGRAYALLGHADAARIEWQTALTQVRERLKTATNDLDFLTDEAVLLACLGEKEEAERGRRLFVSMAETSAGGGTIPNAIALTELGRNEEALKVLSAVLLGKPGLNSSHAYVRFMPDFVVLRHDPRFEKLLRETLPPGAKPFEDQKTEDRGQRTEDREQRTEDGSQKTAPSSLSLSLSTPPDAKSVAVLAFANLSDDKANEYFSDGISEELLNVLAKIPGLKVAARTSAFYFKGKEVPIPEIAKQLGVAYVVEGSVRKQGDKVRIAAQLIKAADGFHVWSDTFTRDLKDIFAVQDEIAGLVVERLSHEILQGATSAPIHSQVATQVRAAARGRTADVRAYELFLRARYAQNQQSREGLDEALKLYREAVVRDPVFAQAWTQLSVTASLAAGAGFLAAPAGFAEARAAAERAMAIEPELAEAHAALCLIRAFHDWDWTGAKAASERALALAPENTDILNAAVAVAIAVGDESRALALAHHSMEIDRLNTQTGVFLTIALYEFGRFEEMETAARNVVQLSAASRAGQNYLGLALYFQGKLSAAEEQAARVPDPSSRRLLEGLIAAARGQRAAASAAAAEVAKSDGTSMAYQIAGLHARNGESDLAFTWLETAYAERDSGLMLVGGDPMLRNLHDDPRWAVFLARMGLGERTKF